MKKRIVIALISLCLIPVPARCDMFGGDVAVLMQILANAIKQLYELENIIQNGRDTLDLMRDINRGVNDSLRVVDSMSPYLDPGLYKDLRNIAGVIEHLRSVYGVPAPSPNEPIQSNTDQVIAESINMNNDMYAYAKNLDQISERIKSYSHDASPGGAVKLTAQTLAVVVQVMNQQMRIQGQALKLQAQGLAVQNKKEKDETRTYLDQAGQLKAAMKTSDLNFEFPRF